LWGTDLHVVTASNPGEALEFTGQVRVGVVIYDVDPWAHDRSDWELLRKAIEPDAPIIGIWSSLEEARRRGLTEEFTLLLLKPVHIDGLRATIIRLFQQTRAS
jgi:hypothetical protein